MNEEEQAIGTIRLRCHLRGVLKRAAHESLTIATALDMGLMPLLEKMARRGHKLNDPELKEYLDVLGL